MGMGNEMLPEMIEFRDWIVKTLKDAGFKDENRWEWDRGYRSFVVGDELRHDPVPGYSFTHLNGVDLTVREVNRSNGTANNVSYRISITRWKDSSGSGIAMWKMSFRDSARKKARVMDEAISEYMRIVSENE